MQTCLAIAIFNHTLTLAALQQLGIVGEQRVLVSVAKTTGSGADAVTFVFECDGLPCTSRNITVSHLTFANTMIFTDMTTVAYQGTVSIAGTGSSNSGNNPCPLSGAKVCVLNHYGANEQIVCRETHSNGSFYCHAYIDFV
jgi:hypothetical protein